MPSQQPSVAGRVLLALGLMIGFYVMALALVSGLLAIVYFDLTNGGRVHGKLVLGCVIGAGVILWAILPRPDKFVAPGVLLRERDQPRLFDEIARIAERTGQAMPREVYLVPDVNAFVTQRGGVMGFGSKRVMGLGLPLLKVMAQTELRGVLAHEFGHYHGGDVKLGPWLYKTRGAIGRAMRAFDSDAILHFPFKLYGKMFLRLTLQVSRRQEYAADALAAEVVGPDSLRQGLTTLAGSGPFFTPFFRDEVVPVLNAGKRPPVAAGFARYLAADGVRKASEELQQASHDEETELYDTHPALPDRLAALAGFPEVSAGGGDASAADLLQDLSALEAELIAFMVRDRKVCEFPPLGWQDVGDEVYLPQYQSIGKGLSAVIGELRVRDLGERVDGLPFLHELVKAIDGEGSRVEQEVRGRATFLLGAALVASMQREGWSLETAPGEPIVMRRGDQVVMPMHLLAPRIMGEMPVDDWQKACHHHGLSELALAV